MDIDNATLAKPFGTIDTPRAGETVSGTIAIFGWALTPDRSTTSGPDAISIPTSGNTMTVFVDGVPVGQVTYDQCRGTRGASLASGEWCDDDIASIFGNLRPEAPLSGRVINPTRFRNLDAGRGAIGAFELDTTTLSNGVHTLAWSVTDSAGRTEGIGSRFFSVFNSVSSAGDSAMMSVARRAAVAQRAAPEALRADVRTGFDLDAPWAALRPASDGWARVRVAAQERVEVRMNHPLDRVVAVGPDGSVRDLPVGSDVTGQTFTWMPPVGYIGVYHFILHAAGSTRRWRCWWRCAERR